MIDVPNKITHPFDKQSVSSLNKRYDQPLSKATIHHINENRVNDGRDGRVAQSERPRVATPTASGTERTQMDREKRTQTSLETGSFRAGSAPADLALPAFCYPLRKGQKTLLSVASQAEGPKRVQVCFGWNIKDQRCDMDASAFLVDASGQVPGDEWFVFYGQTDSPDGCVSFSSEVGKDREIIQVDLERLHSAIQKIVFVLTINEAFEQGLNFSMVKDAYIRLLDSDTGQELVSYCLDEYYENITSITIGELYLHNGQWKFNPVGNGVHQSLAGQCAIYGVEIC